MYSQALFPGLLCLLPWYRGKAYKRCCDVRWADDIDTWGVPDAPWARPFLVMHLQKLGDQSIVKTACTSPTFPLSICKLQVYLTKELASFPGSTCMWTENQISILQVMESWVRPGNEVTNKEYSIFDYFCRYPKFETKFTQVSKLKS